MIYLKIHEAENGAILAMCDSSLIEKVLSEGDIEINIRDYADFYKGQLLNKEEARQAIKKESIGSANIIGPESIAIASEQKIIEKNNIKLVLNVPYANSFRVK